MVASTVKDGNDRLRQAKRQSGPAPQGNMHVNRSLRVDILLLSVLYMEIGDM